MFGPFPQIFLPVDVLTDGSIDDKANSNNGDIVKVLGTIVQIMIDYTGKFPDIEIFFEIFFAGSTPERTRLYFRIVRTYYTLFSKEFTISVLESKGAGFIERPFQPEADMKPHGFIVKRIH